MRAIVYEKQGVLSLESRPKPCLQNERDAIVRVTLASICTSDLHIKHGAVPRAVPGVTVGHEMVGVVEQVGTSVRRVKPGDRVSVCVETFCGECFYCKRGFVNNCADPLGGWALGCRIDGGQADFVRVPHADQGLTRIPETVTDEQALFVGDILATGYWAAQLAEIKQGDTVAVLGAGPAGLCAMMCAGLYGASHVVAVDPLAERLGLAKAQGWADETADPTRDDVDDLIRRLTNGRGADAVIEAAGAADTFQTAWRIARPNAVVVVAAMYETAQRLPLPEMYGKNLTFKTGGVDANASARILRLIEEGRLDTTRLLTHIYPLSAAMDAYELFEKKQDGVIKVALRP